MSHGEKDPIVEMVAKKIICKFYGASVGKSPYYNERGDILLGKIESDIVALVKTALQKNRNGGPSTNKQIKVSPKWPECANDCPVIPCLGASECESVCPDSFQATS